MYYPRQFISGAIFSLTVAPILWGTRVCSVLSFLSLISVFGLVFSTAWVFWSLVWLTTIFFLWLFARFYRFYILALRHLGVIVRRASLRSFLVSVYSVSFVIASLHSFGGCLSFYCVIWVIGFFFIQIPLCLALSLDHMVHLTLGYSAWSSESGLGWEKFFVFSFSGVGACCQLATRAN